MIMHIRRNISIFLSLLSLLIIVADASAQDKLKFSIESFEADPFDYSAKDNKYGKFDGSGDRYAIIKVYSNSNDNLSEYNFNFGNLKHEVELHDGVLWVYVQKNAKLVTITREGYNPINKLDLNTTIESGKNYVLKLSAQPKKIYRQMTQFNVTPSDSRAMITVKNSLEGSQEELFGVVSEIGSIAKNLPFGSYSYKVISDNYQTVEGIFTLDDRINTHVENVTLLPNYSRVTLKVGSDAEIYLNDELIGVGEWTGNLKAGDYQVECRQDNHTSTFEFIHVKDNEDMAITLKSPQKRLGMASVISSPLGATITIDGRNYGVTPQNVELPLGDHFIELSLEGYKTGKMRIDVDENETSEINMQLTTISDENVVSEYRTSNDLVSDAVNFKDGVPIVMDLVIDEYGYITRASDYKWPNDAIIILNCTKDNNLANTGSSMYAKYSSSTGWTLYNFNKSDVMGVPLQYLCFDEAVMSNSDTGITKDASTVITKAVYVDRILDDGNWIGSQSVCSYKDGKFYLTASLQPLYGRFRFFSEKKPPTVRYHDFENVDYRGYIDLYDFDQQKNSETDNDSFFAVMTKSLNFHKEDDGKYYSEYLYSTKVPELKIGSTLYKSTKDESFERGRSSLLALPSSKDTSYLWTSEKFKFLSSQNENLIDDVISQLTYTTESGEIFYIDLLSLLKTSDISKLREHSKGFKTSMGLNVYIALEFEEVEDGAYATIYLSNLDENIKKSRNKKEISIADRYNSFQAFIPNESLNTTINYPYLKIESGVKGKGKLTISDIHISNF